MTYDAIYRGRGRSRKHKSRDCSNSVIKSCKYCGKSHNRGNCPAFGKKCSRDNHFKSMCKSGDDKHELSQSRPKKGKGHKGKKVH